LASTVSTLRLTPGFSLAVECGFDLPFTARRDRLRGLFRYRASTAGLHMLDHQGLVTGVPEPEGYFQFLAFLDLAEILDGIDPLDRGEFEESVTAATGEPARFIIVHAAAGEYGN